MSDLLDPDVLRLLLDDIFDETARRRALAFLRRRDALEKLSAALTSVNGELGNDFELTPANIRHVVRRLLALLEI